MLLKEFRLQFPYKVVLISKECIWLWLYSCYSHFSVAYIKQLKYALVTARFRAQYDQYFPSFSYFTDLFEEPLGEWNNSEIWETRKILRFTILLLWKHMVKFFFTFNYQFLVKLLRYMIVKISLLALISIVYFWNLCFIQSGVCDVSINKVRHKFDIFNSCNRGLRYLDWFFESFHYHFKQAQLFRKKLSVNIVRCYFLSNETTKRFDSIHCKDFRCELLFVTRLCLLGGT